MGVEVPVAEPILVAYHVTKWIKEDDEDAIPTPSVDFNICWAGVLIKDAIQDAILETPVVAMYAKD